MTTGELDDFVENLIGADQDPEWDATKLASFLAAALTKVHGDFGPQIYETTKTVALIDIETNGTANLPADCSKVGAVKIAENGLELTRITEDQIPDFLEDDPADGPAAYIQTGAVLKLYPVCDAAADFLELWYLKTPATIADVPAALHPLIGIEAAKLAKFRDRDFGGDVQAIEMSYLQSARRALGSVGV